MLRGKAVWPVVMAEVEARYAPVDNGRGSTTAWAVVVRSIPNDTYDYVGRGLL